MPINVWMLSVDDFYFKKCKKKKQTHPHTRSHKSLHPVVVVYRFKCVITETIKINCSTESLLLFISPRYDNRIFCWSSPLIKFHFILATANETGQKKRGAKDKLIWKINNNNSSSELKWCSRIKIEIDSARINKIDSHSNYLYIFKRNFMFQMQFCTCGINICGEQSVAKKKSWKRTNQVCVHHHCQQSQIQ